jgi:CBS domain-containing protein
MLCPSCGHENIEGADRCDECLSPLSKLDGDATAGLARSVMEDNLCLLELEETLTVDPGTAAIDVARSMKTARSGCALVVAEGKLLGIFTEHDVLHRMLGADATAANLSVKELMSPDPEFLRESDSVAAALNKMSIGRYRHIPVERHDGSYTVTSIKSVLKYLAKADW